MVVDHVPLLGAIIEELVRNAIEGTGDGRSGGRDVRVVPGAKL